MKMKDEEVSGKRWLLNGFDPRETSFSEQFVILLVCPEF